MAIKKGDTVILRTGKDRGKQGKVLRVMPAANRVLVEGVNVMRKHTRARREGQKGQIVDKAHPVHLSNVGLYCSSCKKAVRVGAKIEGKKKLRICRTCGNKI